MWRLHRYYLKELAANAAITFLVLFGIAMISLVARGIARAQTGTLLDAAWITLLWTLDAFPHLLTISFLLATVLTFGRAQQDRELVAVRAAGISPVVPMTSAVLIGLLLSILGAFGLHYVLPVVHFSKYRVVSEVMRNLVQNRKLDSDRIPIEKFGWLVPSGRDDSSPDRDLVDCTIFQKGERLAGAMSPILRVDRVAIPQPDENSEYLTVRMTGVHDPIHGNTTSGIVEIAIDVRSMSEKERRFDRDEDVTSAQLLGEVMRDVHPEPAGALFTVHRRACFALMPALLAPIGFCIGLFAGQRGRVAAMVWALLPLIAFYVGDIAGVKLLHGTGQPLAAWLPAAILVLGGFPFCWRQLRR